MAIVLQNAPDEVKKIVFSVQGELKAAKSIGQFSQEQTIFHIIREYARLMKIQKSTYKSEE